MSKFSKDNRDSFPKLETGMVVRVANGGIYLVVEDTLLSTNGYLRLRDYTNRGEEYLFNSIGYNIIEVYSGTGMYNLDVYNFANQEEPVWKFQPSETAEKIVELEHTIQLAMNQIKILKGEINV